MYLSSVRWRKLLAFCVIASKRRLTPLVLFCDTAGKEYLDILVDAKTYRKPFGSEIERRDQTTPIRVVPRLHDLYIRPDSFNGKRMDRVAKNIDRINESK